MSQMKELYWIWIHRRIIRGYLVDASNESFRFDFTDYTNRCNSRFVLMCGPWRCIRLYRYHDVLWTHACSDKTHCPDIEYPRLVYCSLSVLQGRVFSMVSLLALRLHIHTLCLYWRISYFACRALSNRRRDHAIV